MNDSNNVDDINVEEVAAKLAENFAKVVDHRKQEAQAAEDARQFAAAELLLHMEEADLSLDQIISVSEFVAKGCNMIIDDAIVNENNNLKAQVASLGRENDDLRQQVIDLNGTFTIAFANQAERDKAEAILATCKNGGGNFIDPKRIEEALKPRQAQPKQKGPSGPPTQPPVSTKDPAGPQKKSLWDKILGKS